MNKYLSNKSNAYSKVKGLLDMNPEIFKASPMARKVVAEFFTALEEIKMVAARAASDTIGETLAKKQAKERMAFVASSLAACGAVYAVERGDEELEVSLKYSYSDLKYGLDNEALHIAKAIESILLEHLDKLGEYLVSPQDLQELRRRIDTYADALEARGGAKSGAVAENKRLKKLFETTDDLLERKLDRFVFRLKEESPDFYVAYVHARRIDDL